MEFHISENHLHQHKNPIRSILVLLDFNPNHKLVFQFKEMESTKC